MLLSFRRKATQRRLGSKIEVKFRIFPALAKLGERWAKRLSHFFVFDLGPNFCFIFLMRGGGRSAVGEIRGPLKIRKNVGKI